MRKLIRSRFTNPWKYTPQDSTSSRRRICVDPWGGGVQGFLWRMHYRTNINVMIWMCVSLHTYYAVAAWKYLICYQHKINFVCVFEGSLASRPDRFCNLFSYIMNKKAEYGDVIENNSFLTDIFPLEGTNKYKWADLDDHVFAYFVNRAREWNRTCLEMSDHVISKR